MLIKVKDWFHRVGGGESCGGEKTNIPDRQRGGKTGRRNQSGKRRKRQHLQLPAVVLILNHCSTRTDCLAFHWEKQGSNRER